MRGRETEITKKWRSGGRWAVDSNLGMGEGSLLAGGLGLDVAVGFCLGGGGDFRRQ
jgi:hypothetical protein